MWPSRLCLRPHSSSEGATSCTSDKDCLTLGDLAPPGRSKGESPLCAQPWSGCRDYFDRSSQGQPANAIKFDFAFFSDQGRARFTQVVFRASIHVLRERYSCNQHFVRVDSTRIDSACGLGALQHLAVTVDFAGTSDTQALQDRARPKELQAAVWHTSAAGPALFSAFACDPGAKNQVTYML